MEIYKWFYRAFEKYPAYRMLSVAVAFTGLLGITAALVTRLGFDSAFFEKPGQALPFALFGVLTALVGLAAVLTLFGDKYRSIDFEKDLLSGYSSIEALDRPRMTLRPSPKTEDTKKVFEQATGVGYISTIFSKTRVGLKSELRKVRVAATQALMFGIFFCFISIGATIYFITNGSALTDGSSSLYAFLIYYLPRLSVAVMAQIVALFFLNLSIINQRDARSVRNEITNLDMREAAIVIAMLNEDVDVAARASEALLRTERNFLLRRGERVMHEGDQYEHLSEQLAALAKVVEAAKPSRAA